MSSDAPEEQKCRQATSPEEEKFPPSRPRSCGGREGEWRPRLGGGRHESPARVVCESSLQRHGASILGSSTLLPVSSGDGPHETRLSP